MRTLCVILGVAVAGGCAADDAEGGEASTGGTSANADASGTSADRGSTDDAADDAPALDDAATDGGSSGAPFEDGSTSAPAANDETTGADDRPQLPPTGARALVPWLQDGQYLHWTAESGVHGSAGPHFGGVRTFVNDALLQSLQADGAEHPVDAAAVKELYGDGDAIRGWSVMVKTASGTSGDAWYWLEVYDTSTYADGQGAGICTGCHGAGQNFFMSPFPLQ